LVIRNATVVTTGHRETADIGIAGGRIAQLGGPMTGTGELAADGLLALPGGVDAHTHLVYQGLSDKLGFPIWVDDFWSGSRAAIAGGLRHCEDGAMLRQAGEKLIAEGRGAVANFPAARPVAAEVAAVEVAIGIARRTGARIYIVHLSSAAALDRCRRARAAGLPVYVETRPLYLHLTSERFAEPDAGKYVGAPPLREACDRDALWAGLAAGDVDTVCSDHAPWTLDAKLDPALDAVTARQGVADLETLIPMLYSEG